MKTYIAIINHIKGKEERLFKEMRSKRLEKPLENGYMQRRERRERKEEMIADSLQSNPFRSIRKDRYDSAHYRRQERLWSRDMERELIGFYKKDDDLVHACTYFKQIFEEHAKYITAKFLRRQLHRIIRTALRKLRAYLTAKGLSHSLVDMSERRIKYFMQTQSMPVVQHLLRVYTEDFTEEQLDEIVKTINAYVAKKDLERSLSAEDEEEAKFDEESRLGEEYTQF